VSSAVEALLEGHTPAARHGKRSAYRAMCACCAPEPEALEGKPQRRSVNRPTLAWRTRLAAQQALAEGAGETSV
jgi:hypothetical protein